MIKRFANQIPNAITCCNLICGCIAIYSAFNGQLAHALYFIVLGAMFDFFDGFAARLLNSISTIGKELDSLADVVTFGVAPASMIFVVLQGLITTSTHLYSLEGLPFIAFLLAAFSALRLAKFNIDTRQTTSFIGLPTPANALFWSSIAMGLEQYEEICQTYPTTVIIVIVIFILLSCYIMVAEIPMFSLKIKGFSWEENKIKYIFLIPCIPIVIALKFSGFAAIIVWYVVLSIVVRYRK